MGLFFVVCKYEVATAPKKAWYSYVTIEELGSILDCSNHHQEKGTS